LPQAQGSGFIYDMDGHIVTNNHVVDNAQDIVVYVQNGMWADAEVVATDPQADIAVLKVDPPQGVEWKPLTLAAPDALLPGYYVIAVGSPFGLEETMTLGVISALGRALPTGDALSGSRYSLPDVIQTDTAINPGNSGGPLLNLNGEVVGINFAINSTAGSNSGVGFAIPVSVVQKVAPALIAEGKFDYAYLGIAGQTINAFVAEESEIADNTLGVIVAEVVSGGPAGEAGIQTDDIIVGIGGETVTQFEDLISYLFNEAAPGTPVTLSVLRGDETLDIDVTLDKRPEPVVETANEGESDGEITIAEAIKIAKSAVSEAELMESIDSANAKRSELDGQDVWVVTLSGNEKAASVTVDATSGEVIELDVQ
jgi:2-alkenal reductase